MELTPRQIVAELSRYIIGQEDAKKAVAVALRNRYRRAQLPENIREEITPKNIILKGPTGVGKTEIARRLAKLVKAPFVKVEATKFTEVGYVGRDVESMIRDLAEVSVRMVRDERLKEVEEKAYPNAERQVVNALIDTLKKANKDKTHDELERMAKKGIEDGTLLDTLIDIKLPQVQKPMELAPGTGIELDLGNIFGNIFPENVKDRQVTVKDALKTLIEIESDKLIDADSVNEEAIRRAENQGIIFIDEIDKIAGKGNNSGPDVSREGVQRDILPIVEGCTVNTKYGTIRTDFILFIGSGAFHIAEFSDLIPELQGRFPVVVSLDSLSESDFVEILQNTDNAILKQYTQLLSVDKLNLKFTAEAIGEIAKIAVTENQTQEDIGARRLHSVLENLLDDISFNAGGLDTEVEFVIDKNYVEKHFEKTIKTMNLKKYIL